MMQQDKLNRYNELKKLIDKYNYYYYQLNESLISDYEYDLLYKELEQLEREIGLVEEKSPTALVGNDITGKFVPVEHKRPMLSLQNSYSYDELLAFNNRIKEILNIKDDNLIDYVCEHKFDGLSISLIYENGILTRALTRGDGKVGEDVTANILTIKNIPHKIEDKDYQNFEVRGEVYIEFEDFNKINLQRIEDGLPEFANPRNFVSGTVKTLDIKVVAERPLKIAPYYLYTAEKISTHWEALQILKKLNFPVNEHIKLCKNIKEVINYCKLWEDKRENLPYPIDGVVIKVNKIEYQNILGSISKFPRWAVAFKYKPEQAVTKLLSVDWQVGRTGAITPVANLEPVKLSGSTISRATLHNYDFIKTLDLKIGDDVVIEKGGEVIPKIVSVANRKDDLFTIDVEHPQHCPICNSKLVKPLNEVLCYCVNDECPAKLKAKLIHFSSKNAMDIAGLGEANINLFFDKGFIKYIDDIYKLPELKNEIINLDRFGEKSFINIAKSIEESKKKPFHKVLFALGIRYVGESVARILVEHFKNIDNLINASENEISEIYEIGEAISKSVVNYFKDEKNISIINNLKKYGLKFSIDEIEKVGNKLAGLTFVVTGTLKNYTREQIKEVIIKNGGNVSESVSKKTSYLVLGKEPGSKYQKALSLGVKIINEDEFNKLIQ
ncbi:MAG TPA: NAD-dependent DNA ligase LigA [Ignavibacteriales bacterium]|nr:NAD-dependent DNA ligase LigA [Ignavibacteriales bacterium]